MAEKLPQPYSGNRPSQRAGEYDPLRAFRREMNRLFDGVFRDFGWPSLTGSSAGALAPQIDMSETDRELQITAELPGIDEKDVEVLLDGDTLTLCGKKKAEREEKDRSHHLMERSHGTFVRSVALPFSPDPNQVKAAYKDGLLTVTIEKPKEVRDKVRRIEVRRDSAPTVSRTERAQASTADTKVPETAAD
jgi:HSP20 family protein